MESTSGVLRRARRWNRARKSFRAALTACVGCGAAAAVAARFTGFDLPPIAWTAVGMGAALGWLWPTQAERALLALGRAVGLDERLASLQALSDRPTSGVATLLAAEVGRRRWRLWRLAAGRWEIGALAVGALLVSSLWLPASDGPPATEMATALEGHTEAAEEESDQPERPEALVPPQLASVGTAEYTPYIDLLATVLGLEDASELWEDPDALARALSAQQGLLREIAGRLEELASAGADVGTAGEVAELAAEVAREDLRQVLQSAARSGDRERVAEAQQAVDAVLRAEDGLQRPGDAADVPADGTAYEDGEMPPDGIEGQPAAREGEAAAEAATGEPGPEDLPEGMLEFPGMNGVAGEQPARDELAPEDAEHGGPPGAAHAGPPPGGEFAAPAIGPDEAVVPIAVRADDGTWRAYLVVDVPGETAGELGDTVELSPHEVDLLLRTRAVPPDLRDVVRRYFEQVSVHGGGKE